MRSGDTRKVSLTPDRLRTMEVRLMIVHTLVHSDHTTGLQAGKKPTIKTISSREHSALSKGFALATSFRHPLKTCRRPAPISACCRLYR